MKKAAILLSVFVTTSVFAQKEDQTVTVSCSHFGVSKPLRELFVNENELTQDDKKESSDREHRTTQVFLHTAEEGAVYGESSLVRQTEMGVRSSSATIVSFAGQNGVRPPDPSGAVGPNHYVQAVNATPFKVFNKTTGAGIGTVKNIGSLWSPAVGNLGDPIILYDRYADRWFLSQFGSGNKIYIAISTTNDPTGTYYTYTFTSPDFPDYLKFSIWWDGYYMTANYAQKIFCFERDQMLLGNPSARAFYKSYSTATGSGFFCTMPGDADGGLPAIGTPFPFFQYTDNAWGGGAVDGIKIFKMSTTWGSSPSATISVDATVPLSAFDASYSPSWDDITQPGTSQKLDGIGGILQYRVPWRKWTGYNSVVLNFPVKISSTQRSIRWCELRQDQATGSWSLHQESTYTPDAHSRWVGSVAMDDNGSIALCYAKSSSTVNPSLAYTGRLATDPLGQMTFAETVVKAGTGFQTGSNRFGDYAQTTVDVDGETFWHTGEYLSGGLPRTWIYSFKLSAFTSTIDEETINENLIAWQNNNDLQIKATGLPVTGQLSVDLFDVRGNLIQNQLVTTNNTMMNSSMDITAVATGTYLLRVGKTNTNFQKIIKVVITR